MICPWFGDLPAWWDRYLERLGNTGCEFMFDHDLDAFRQRVGDILGIRCPIEPGSAKIHDYRPAFAHLYADEIAGHEWWGHTDFDCVYGRVGEFVTDELLAGCDIQTDCAYDYLAGPWTLYRATPAIADLYLEKPSWATILQDDYVHGWVETSFSEIAKRWARVRVDFFHDYRMRGVLRDRDGRLIYEGREISFFHFRQSKAWPL